MSETKIGAIAKCIQDGVAKFRVVSLSIRAELIRGEYNANRVFVPVDLEPVGDLVITFPIDPDKVNKDGTVEIEVLGDIAGQALRALVDSQLEVLTRLLAQRTLLEVTTKPGPVWQGDESEEATGALPKVEVVMPTVESDGADSLPAAESVDDALTDLAALDFGE